MLRTELTAIETGYDSSPPDIAGASRASRSALLELPGSSQSVHRAGSITIGIRSWILPTLSSARVVMIVDVHSQARGWSSG